MFLTTKLGRRLRVLKREPQILTDDAEAERGEAAEEGDDEHQRRIAEYRDATEEPEHENRRPADDRGGGAERAEDEQRANRQVGKAEDAVERVADFPAECPSAAALGTSPAFVGDEAAAEAEPEQQRDQVGVDLGQLEQPIAHLPGASEHVDAALRHVLDDEAAIQRPEGLRRELRPPAVGPPRAVPEDHVHVAGGEPAMELERQLRRLLQIGREDGEVVAGAVAQSGGDRGE